MVEERESTQVCKLASKQASKLRRRRATEDMHVSGEAGPPPPPLVSSQLGCILCLLPRLCCCCCWSAHVGKKARWVGVGVSGMFWCVLLGVSGGESSGVTRWSCRTRMYSFVLRCVACGRGDEGAREIPRWRRGAACSVRLSVCLSVPVSTCVWCVWHGLTQRRRTHPSGPNRYRRLLFRTGRWAFLERRAARLRGPSQPTTDRPVPLPFWLAWHGLHGLREAPWTLAYGSGEGVGCWCGVSLLG